MRLTHHCAREGNTAALLQKNVVRFQVLGHTKAHGERAHGDTHTHTHKKHPARVTRRVPMFRHTRPGPGQWTAEHSPGWVPHMQHNDKHVMCGEALQPKGDGGRPTGRSGAARGTNHSMNRKCSTI